MAVWVVMTAGAADAAGAQTSIVPPQHAVYEWLHHQRVLGNLPEYQFEILPLSRGQINTLLGSLASDADRLDGTDRRLLEAFTREFSPAALREASGTSPLEGGEPHLFVHADERASVAVDGLAAIGAFNGNGADADGTAALPELGVRSYAGWGEHFGAYVEVDRALTSGSVRAVRYQPSYNRTDEVVDDLGGGSWYVQAMASARYGVLNADAGTGALRMGASFGEPLLINPDVSGLRWLRFRVDTPHFKYVALHGGLDTPLGPAVIQRSDGTTVTSAANERHFALHRYEIWLHPRLALAFTDAIVYSARPLDLAYLNPVNVLFFSELDSDDRDNVLWFFELTWRVIDGVEIYGTLLGDDLAHGYQIIPITAQEPNVDRGFDGGVTVALPLGLDASARFVRIEPLVYSHWQRLNAFEQNGFPLGFSTGPNSDRALARLRKWLPNRGWVAATVSRTRKGLNPIDGLGQVVRNVGGDVTLGTIFDEGLATFEGSDLQQYWEVALEGTFEPRRGVSVSARYQRRDPTLGTRIGFQDLFTLRVGLGY